MAYLVHEINAFVICNQNHNGCALTMTIICNAKPTITWHHAFTATSSNVVLANKTGVYRLS
eukprot:m.358048 g.358048  ORF g.358048 m.358048 type:complete len:61 (+) comp18021_c0_seq1:1819-2001(+)